MGAGKSRAAARMAHGAVLAMALSGCGRTQHDPGLLVLPGRGASSYAEASGPSPLSRLVERRLAGAGTAPLSPEPCLDRAAELLAERLDSECELWPGWIEEHVLHHAGCPDFAADAIVVCGRGKDPKGFLDRVAIEAPKLRADRFGSGRAAQGLFRSAWVFAAVERGAGLDPVPRSVPPESRVRLGFSLAPGLEAPRVYSMGPAGGVASEPVLLGSEPGRHLAFVRLAGPGRYWLEIMADGR
ncbi:MAG: hypothetical protein WC943_16415, partial [Elusimicrobiota bacterium]